MRYYTIKEASEKTGLKAHRIRHLVKKGTIRSTRENGINKPYQIPASELEKLTEKSKKVEVTKEVTEELGLEPTSASDPIMIEENSLSDFLAIQKTLADRMRDLASAQEQIAQTLRELAKRV